MQARIGLTITTSRNLETSQEGELPTIVEARRVAGNGGDYPVPAIALTQVSGAPLIKLKSLVGFGELLSK
jgi:hypothetical protein